MSISLSALKLGGVLKKFGNFSLKEFNDRLVLQKRVYLLQAFGIFMGYKFSWYIHGPYSPTLTKDAYKLDTIFDKVPEINFAKNIHKKRFIEYLKFLDDKRNDGDWLEQLACIHFLKNIYPKKNHDEIIHLVLDHEAHFTRDQCEEAYGHLVKWELIEN